jgi:hypothetical protein
MHFLPKRVILQCTAIVSHVQHVPNTGSFSQKNLNENGEIDIFILSVLCSSTKGPGVRWLQHLGISPLSKQYLEVSGLLPYSHIKGLCICSTGGWVKELEEHGWDSFGGKELKVNAVKQFILCLKITTLLSDILYNIGCSFFGREAT